MSEDLDHLGGALKVDLDHLGGALKVINNQFFRDHTSLVTNRPIMMNESLLPSYFPSLNMCAGSLTSVPTMHHTMPNIDLALCVPHQFVDHRDGFSDKPSAEMVFSDKPSTSSSRGQKKTSHQKHFLDVFNQKPFRLTVKVKVPVLEHPKFNFVGKLLGPKGNSLKRLQEKTQTRMAVFGRGSMKTRLQELKLLESGDPKYKHLEDDLHVEISTYGPPVQVYQRIANALSEVRQYLVPDQNDDIRQQQRIEQTQLTRKQETTTLQDDS